jgi:predicted RNase H-like nuclease
VAVRRHRSFRLIAAGHIDTSTCHDPEMSPPRVLGVDAYKHGWVGIALTVGYDSAYVAPRIDELVATAEADGALDVVAVDMPIGLPDAGPRRADVLAKRRVGPRHASVFITPIRAALLAENFLQAVEIARLRAGGGISRQAYALRPKLLEVDAWVQRGTHHVVEVHPEVSFAALADRPLGAGKRTWGGATVRRRLLADAGITLPDGLGVADVAGVDDVLDASVAAWTARRVARREARSLPEDPEAFSDGLEAAIWY